MKWGAQSSDADDVAQQVLLKLLTAMKSYRPDPATSFRGWLKTVTHNAWLDFVRRPRNGQSPAGLDAIADSSDALADLEKEMQQAFEREILDLAMRRVEDRVKPSTWQAFRLTSIENLSGAEAAERLSVPVSSSFRRQAPGAQAPRGGSQEAECGATDIDTRFEVSEASVIECIRSGRSA